MKPNASQIKILLISSPQKEKCFIREALENTNYQIFEAKSSKAGIQKAIEYLPDLIICQNETIGYNGFQMYNILKDTLIKEGILYFIYSDNFDKEDILIGLEMGVDNFIISPVDKNMLVEKIERQVRKEKERRKVENETFRIFLEATPVAKFIVSNNRIELANKAFYSLLQVPDDKRNNPLFTDIFHLAGNHNNAVRYKKCMNGFIRHCRINEVSSVQEQNCSYDIFLHYSDRNGKGSLFGEVTRSMKKNPGRGKNGKEFHINSNGKTIPGSLKVKLTSREEQVLQFSIQGLPVKLIAEQLEVSQRTVEKHRANIMKKTNTSNILEAIYVVSNLKNYGI